MTALDERPVPVRPAAPPRPVPNVPPVPDVPDGANNAGSPTGAGRAPGADLLRSVLRRHAAGVTVITVTGPGGPAGFTATSFTSVSLEPALVSFYLSATASAAPAVRAADAFTVHVLRAGQGELASRFARSGIDRFAGTDWRPGPHGTPVLAGAAARLTARPVLLQPVGDHLLVVGEVLDADADGGPPLLHHDGGFGGFAPAGEG